MNFTTLLLFFLASVGMTHIIVDGTVFRKQLSAIPFLNKLTECHQCTGFWCGAFCAPLILIYTKAGIFCDPMTFTYTKIVANYVVLIPLIFLMACATSFTSMLGRALLDYLELNVTIPLTDDHVVYEAIDEETSH